VLQKVESILAEQSQKKRNEAIVLTIYEDQKELINCSRYFDDGYGSLGFDYESQEEEMHRLQQLTPQCLRGKAAELRDHLVKRGFHIELQYRTGGGPTRSSCNRIYSVWDLIAHW
jgi:hypothetical protein